MFKVGQYGDGGAPEYFDTNASFVSSGHRSIIHFLDLISVMFNVFLLKKFVSI